MLKQWAENFMAEPDLQLYTQTQKDFLVGLLLLETANIEEPPEIMMFLETTPTYVVITSRAAWLNLKMTTKAKGFLSEFAKRFGDISMYLAILKYYAMSKNKDIISILDIHALWDTGLPSRATLDKYWDLQKGPRGENLLDLESTYGISNPS